MLWVGIDASIGSPTLLGVWKENDGADEGDVRGGVLIDPASDGIVLRLLSARMLYLLLLLVTMGGLNGWTEKLGLSQSGLGQNHRTSGPSDSKSWKVFVDIPIQSLCIQLLQVSQHRAWHSQVTWWLHLGQK